MPTTLVVSVIESEGTKTPEPFTEEQLNNNVIYGDAAHDRDPAHP